MKQFFRYLFVGSLALIPFLVVMQIIFWAQTLSVDLFDYVSSYTNNTIFTLAIITATILALAIIGSSIEKAGKSFVVSIIENILNRLPAIRNIYGIVKKITELFKPNSKDDKKEVVLVEYPKKDLWVPAYVLSKHDGVLVLFVPTSPNPTSGYTVIVDRTKVKQTTYTVAEASQFIVSMGADFVKKEEISNIVKNTLKEDMEK
ncbi:MAG: DUF502 domain-containing protein [Campylobacterota bacterium]|nr:DUF502 domain-containing protein [Campylobacterota bacterium]